VGQFGVNRFFRRTVPWRRMEDIASNTAGLEGLATSIGYMDSNIIGGLSSGSSTVNQATLGLDRLIRMDLLYR